MRSGNVLELDTYNRVDVLNAAISDVQQKLSLSSLSEDQHARLLKFYNTLVELRKSARGAVPGSDT